MKIRLTLLLATAVFFLAVSSANAFGISPVKILLTTDAGATQTVILKINNSTPLSGGQAEKTDITFQLNVLGVEQDNAGLPVFGRGVEEAENWVYPENSTIHIKSGETKSVNFIIKTPKDATAGSHYLALAVEPILKSNAGNSVNSRLISLLTLQVAGLVSEELLIEKWEPMAKFSDDKSLKFNLKLKNNGVVEVPLKGSVVVRNWQGDEIFSEPLVLGNKLLAGSYRALSPTIVLRDNISLPGLYQTQLKINYGLTNQMSSAIAYVWYFPRWSQVAAIIFGLLIIITLIFFIRRKK